MAIDPDPDLIDCKFVNISRVIGYEGLDPKLKGKRLMQSFMYMKMFEGDNHYAHPLDFAPSKHSEL